MPALPVWLVPLCLCMEGRATPASGWEPGGRTAPPATPMGLVTMQETNTGVGLLITVNSKYPTLLNNALGSEAVAIQSQLNE